jgi:hypothetical protein
MPKSREDYIYQFILGCLAGVYTDSGKDFETNSLKKLFHESSVLQKITEFLQILRGDIELLDSQLSRSKEFLLQNRKEVKVLD